MLTILIIMYICGMFVSAFILSLLSMFTPLTYKVLNILCVILWPIVWGLTMVGVTLMMVGYIGWVVGKRVVKVFNMRSN